MNYESSDESEDTDLYDMVVDEQEAAETAEITQKILKGDSLEEYKQVIVESTRLRDVYNSRWWNPDLDGCYFAMYNYSQSKIAKGDELIFSYGMRGNSHLLEK